jgi:O-antigen/teichoic acid export membrane protein
MDIKQRFVSGILTGMGSVVLKTTLNLLLIPILIRQLGGEGYGLYVLMVGVLEMALMMDMGFTNGIVSLLGGFRAKTDPDSVRQGDDLMTLGQWLYGGLSVLVGVLGLLLLVPNFANWFHIPTHLLQTTNACILIVVAEAVLTLYQSFFRAILLAHCATHWTNVSESLYHLLGNGIGLILVICGFGVQGLLLARLVAAVVRMVIMGRQAYGFEGGVLSQSIIPKWPANAWGSFKTLLTKSTHAMLLNLSIYASHGIDQFVIARFLPLRQVGVYEIVFRFMQIAVNIGTKMCEGLLPMFSRMASNDEQGQAKSLFIRMSFLNNFITSSILLSIVCFYPNLFSVFTGGNIPIKDTYPILWIALPIFWSGALQLPASYYLYSSGREKYLTISSVITAVVNVVLSISLVKPYGLVGVALGTLIPQLIQHQLSLVTTARKGLGVGLWDYIQAVHIRVLIPLAVAFLFMQVSAGSVLWVGQQAMPLVGDSLAHWLMLGVVGWLVMLGLGLAGWVWHQFMAPPEDKEVVAKAQQKVLRLLQKQGA